MTLIFSLAILFCPNPIPSHFCSAQRHPDRLRVRFPQVLHPVYFKYIFEGFEERTPFYGSGASDAVCTLVCNVDLPEAWWLCDQSSFAVHCYCQTPYGFDSDTENRPIAHLAIVKHKVYS